MLIPVPPDDPFAGILVKLQRADENIDNLGREIRRFFQECKYPVMPNDDDKRWQDAVDYHRSLAIPKRFSVLVGEIVHHWRSCLDHIVWNFSDPTYRSTHETRIQFPILIEQPSANEIKRLERQIGGIADPSDARGLILELQPYKLGADAIDSPLSIVHNMDRADKHRELVIVQAIGNLVLPPDTPPNVVAAATVYGQGKDELLSKAERNAVYRALHEHGKFFPEVAFAEFGKRKGQFVIPSLRKLSGHIEKLVAVFMAALQ